MPSIMIMLFLLEKQERREIKQSQSDTTGETELGWFTVMTTDEKQPILMTTVVEMSDFLWW